MNVQGYHAAEERTRIDSQRSNTRSKSCKTSVFVTGARLHCDPELFGSVLRLEKMNAKCADLCGLDFVHSSCGRRFVH
eukprot:5519159-Amphidinium_carterae.1